MRLFISCFSFLLALFIFPFPTHAQDTFQLLTPTTGWYMTYDRLFYTTDSGAHWSDISPIKDHSTTPSNVLALHFRDPRTAWALIIVDSGPRPECDHNFDYEFVSTTDAGTHWQRHAIPIPPATTCPRGLYLGSEIFFLDSAHGWVNLVINSKPDSPISILLYTTDGGTTWHQSEANPCGPGPLLFNTPQDGWLLSREMHQLCVTHNAGKAFAPEKLPAHISPDDVPGYSLPTFLSDKITAFVPVTYATPIYGVHHFEGGFVVYETKDGGLTWHRSMVFGNFFLDEFIGTSIAGDRIFFLTPGDGKYCIRLGQAMTHGGGGFQYTTKILNITLGFADYQSGWIYLEDVGLLATHDAGKTWTNITPEAEARLPNLHPHTNVEQ